MPPEQHSETRVFNLPRVAEPSFARNFVRLAVCELRFPTLLEYENKPPVALQSALRKSYPHFDKGRSVNVGPGKLESGETRYIMRSKQRHTAISFRSSAVSLEVTRYDNYRSFRARLEELIAAAAKIIDSDFYTRVGLRYVNALPNDEIQGVPEGWVAPQLLAPVSGGELGTISRFWQEIRGATEIGGFLLRHGIPGTDDSNNDYFLDFDFFAEEIESTEVLPTVDTLHEYSRSMFAWCAGPTTLEQMKRLPRTEG